MIEIYRITCLLTILIVPIADLGVGNIVDIDPLDMGKMIIVPFYPNFIFFFDDDDLLILYFISAAACQTGVQSVCN